MKNHLILIFGIIFFLLSSLTHAQTDRDFMALAKDFFRAGDYDDALPLYKQATEKNPNNALAHLMCGKCYIETTCCKQDAVASFLRAYELDPTVDQKIYYLIADAYHLTYDFDNGILYYKKYKEELEINRRDYLGLDVDKEIKKAERGIYECENGKEYIASPLRIQVKNVGSNINSTFEDYAPAISSTNDVVYFTSKRSGGISDIKNIDNDFFEDIWFSTLIDSEWTAPVNIGAPVNDAGHNSAISLSPNGERLFIYSAENNGDILYTDKKNNSEWSTPKPFEALNTEFVESSISITSDGKMMFFTSNKPGGFGGKDIYYCELNDELECKGTPKNIGATLNSEYDEEAPFYDITNNILYFASKGHKGMGGYDLYESSFNEAINKWSDPVNLGTPVNSTDDDVFMSVTGDGKIGYYATYKEDSYGGTDIYMIYPIDRILEDPIDSTSLAQTNVISGADTTQKSGFSSSVLLKVKDENGNPLNAKIEIRLKESNKILKTGTATDGEFLFETSYLNENNYTVSSELNSYFFHNDNFTLNASNDGKQLEINITLKKTQVLEIRPLRNIYFGFDKYTLTPQSSVEIDKLYNLLQNDPNIHIEVAGHTDFIGTAEYNKNLSYQRANAVCKALIKKGISPERLKAKGYGEAYPLATNDDELEGRELNRRTEFIIIPH